MVAVVVLAVMLSTAIAMAHIMDPFILILLFSRLFSHIYMHSLVRADVGPQLFFKIESIFAYTQIPLIVVAVVLVVKLSTTIDIVLDVHYIERKWFIVADFLFTILGIYIVMYLLMNRGISNDLERNSVSKKAESTISYITNGFIFILKYTILNICFSILVSYVTFFTHSIIILLQNYLAYNQLSVYCVILNCLLTPMILSLQTFVFNIVKKV